MDRSYRRAAGGAGARVSLAALAEVEISLKRLDRRRNEAHHVGQPIGGGHPCPELTEIEPGLTQVGLERPQLRLAAEDGLRIARRLKQRRMRLGQHEDEYGVLVARAVARMLEREVLGQEARQVRIELGDGDGGPPLPWRLPHRLSGLPIRLILEDAVLAPCAHAIRLLAKLLDRRRVQHGRHPRL